MQCTEIVPAPSSSSPSSLPQLVPFLTGIAIVVAILLVATFFWGIPVQAVFHFDFRSMYTAGYLERTHPSQLYNVAVQQDLENRLVSVTRYPIPFIHPAYEALLFVPFSLLPYTAAYVAWLVFNALLSVGCVLAGRELFSVPIPMIQPRPGLMLFLFFPFYEVFLQGQDSILLLLILLLAWGQLERGEDGKSGLILALALFRFQLALPLAIMIIIRRGRRFAGGFAAGTAVVAVGLVLCSAGNIAGYVHLLRNTAEAHGIFGAAGIIRPLMMANLRGLLFAAFGKLLTEPALKVLSVTASLAMLFLVAVYQRRFRSELMAFSASLLACLLASYYLYPHDLAALVIPILAIAKEMRVWRNPLIFLLFCSPVVFLFLSNNTFCFTAGFMAIALGAMLAFSEKKVHMAEI